MGSIITPFFTLHRLSRHYSLDLGLYCGKMHLKKLKYKYRGVKNEISCSIFGYADFKIII